MNLFHCYFQGKFAFFKILFSFCFFYSLKLCCAKNKPLKKLKSLKTELHSSSSISGEGGFIFKWMDVSCGLKVHFGLKCQALIVALKGNQTKYTLRSSLKS